ncbi:MAG TPA: hypothetical protein VFG86_28455 [Chloroflexota bacterium]|nr:hypothetical protein [Chloroflexota bacterium]
MRTSRNVLCLLLGILLAACGANGTPANRPANAPSANPVPAGTSAPPNAAPTLQLTPPGLPAGGFPPLDRALAGQIVFSNGDGDIYLIDVKPGAKPQKVIGSPDNKGFVQEPAWSPDGKQIVYSYLVPFDTSGLPSQDLLLANADGSQPQTVLAHQLSGETFSMPVFSSDRRFIYYTHTTPIFKDKQIVNATVKLERYELQTRQMNVVADDGALAAMHPDGKRIAYVHTDPDTFQQSLVVSDLDGKNAKTILAGNSLGGGIYSPAWSRDGSRLIFDVPNFFADNSPTQQRVAMRPHPTSPAVRLAPRSGRGWRDGVGAPGMFAHLFDFLFDVHVAEAHGPPWDFWIVDADGKNLQRMTEIGEDMPYAVFSPDGKQFAFMGLAGIYILDADGKNIHSLFRDGGHGRLDWKK